MPYVRLARTFDAGDIVLNVTNQTAPGYWQYPETMTPNGIPGMATLAMLYRYFRVKSVTVQYTPSLRSDEYNKLFAWPTGGHQELYNAKGACLEIKHLKDWGNLTAVDVNSWQKCLNKAGVIRRCATTKPFRIKRKPKVTQELGDDDPGTADPRRLITAPWFDTQRNANLGETHYIGHNAFHSMNNISYDNSMPLILNRRYVFEVEFKGLLL